MAKLYIKINGIKQIIAIGRKKDMEKIKEKMKKDKDKIRKYKIEEIWIEE